MLAQLPERGGSVEAIIEERGLEAVSDAGVLEAVVREVLDANPENVAKYRGGEERVFNFFVGQVMKRTQGKANPPTVREVLTRLLAP